MLIHIQRALIFETHISLVNHSTHAHDCTRKHTPLLLLSSSFFFFFVAVVVICAYLGKVTDHFWMGTLEAMLASASRPLPYTLACCEGYVQVLKENTHARHFIYLFLFVCSVPDTMSASFPFSPTFHPVLCLFFLYPAPCNPLISLT